MISRLLFSFLGMLALCQVVAQNGNQTWLQDDNFQKSISVYDPNGKAFINTYNDIDGSPFYNIDWKSCSITLSDGKKFNHVLLKLDLQAQSVHYLGQNSAEIEIQPGLIKEIIMTDSGKGGVSTTTFQSGFPPLHNQKENDFFEVLTQGKIALLRLITKKIVQDKNEFSGEVKNKFVTEEDYFYYSKLTLERLRRDKSLYDLFWDKKDAVLDYATKNKLGYKSTDDIRKIIAYYNSL